MRGRVSAAVLVAACVVQVYAALGSAAASDEGAALSLIQAGSQGPSAAVIEADFGRPLPDRLGHDGQQNYAIARDPWHPDDVAPHLDRPHYRLQRPLHPVLAWALHPSGGGSGLVWALAAVNIAALGGVAWATARVANRLGCPWWAPVLVVVLPVVHDTLRLTTSDLLALALVLLAVDAHLAGRVRRATAWGCLAVLAKESSLLVLAGLWLARRDRRTLPVVAVPAAVVGALAVVLRLTVDADGPAVVELGWPFEGLWQSFDRAWLEGDHQVAAWVVVGALVIGAAALASTAWSHPLAPALALQLAFTTLLSADVLGLNANGPRTTAALQVLAVLVGTSSEVRQPSAAPA